MDKYMATFELTEITALTDGENRMLERAKELPVDYNDDPPECTTEMERAFAAARKRVPV